MARVLVKTVGNLATSTEEGLVSTVAQNFAGDKTFDNAVTIAGFLSAIGGISRLVGSQVINAGATASIHTTEGAGSMYLCLAGCYSGSGAGNFFALYGFLETGASTLRTFGIANATYTWGASGTTIQLTNATANNHTIHWTILRLK